jgi:hypothetical protein
MLSLAALNAWEWHEYYAAIPATGGDARAMTMDSSELLGSVAVTSLMQGLIWASLVIVPGASAAKSSIFRSSTRVAVAAAVVVLSSLAFCAFRTIHSVAPLDVFVAIGGLIGLVGIGVALWVLPPNTSLERTRGR